MTYKTPIAKAAEDVAAAIENGEFDYQEGEEFAANLAERFRRRLEKEVEQRITHHSDSLEQELIDDGHNQCRRAIGLTDHESEVV